MTTKTIRDTLIRMARERGIESTYCPSEVARHLHPVNWREHMEEVREQAWKLVDEGLLIVLQKGKEVNRNEVKGPIRLRKP